MGKDERTTLLAGGGTLDGYADECVKPRAGRGIEMDFSAKDSGSFADHGKSQTAF